MLVVRVPIVNILYIILSIIYVVACIYYHHNNIITTASGDLRYVHAEPEVSPTTARRPKSLWRTR